jgi:hypothetical protein
MRKDELSDKDHTLLFGPYRAPTCVAGDWLDDAYYGRCEVAGFTTAPMSWPRARRKGPAAPILTDELVRAVKSESACAVAYWWGISYTQVQNWRRWMGVGRRTEGTARLLANSAKSAPAVAVREAIASRKRGKPQPAHVRAMLLEHAKKPKPKEWAAKARKWMVEGQIRAKAKP